MDLPPSLIKIITKKSQKKISSDFFNSRGGRGYVIFKLVFKSCQVHWGKKQFRFENCLGILNQVNKWTIHIKRSLNMLFKFNPAGLDQQLQRWCYFATEKSGLQVGIQTFTQTKHVFYILPICWRNEPLWDYLFIYSRLQLGLYIFNFFQIVVLS